MKGLWLKAFVSFASYSLISSCGGGGGGSPTIRADLYITDAQENTYQSVIVRIYEINLCSDNACQSKINLFTNQQGVEIDLKRLENVMQYLNTGDIPQGTYNRLEVILDKNLSVDNNPAQFNSISQTNKPNTVYCHADNKCHIRFNGIVQPFSVGKFAVDFDLKQFQINQNTSPWTVTDLLMKPLTPAEVGNRGFVLFLTVNSMGNDSFTGSWMSRTYTVSLNQSTTCSINHTFYSGQQCLQHLQRDMCYMVRVRQDPSAYTSLIASDISSAPQRLCVR
ncbi:MAG: DUF4382 domain-containing protein [Aquificaceae bacterium]|jgi:hypothetical protein|uniref:DUF4382 domain-containing protein n=1 Tax=Hydrogenobacter sp. Uz 6-8 TaxID=3384828 RepID=UPI000F149489|nr:MAG: DUF4382 domain-containing protein [Aquificota bacterium]